MAPQIRDLIIAISVTGQQCKARRVPYGVNRLPLEHFSVRLHLSP
jgi:hypothetical protein